MELGESSLPRRVTRQVMVGSVPVGGGAPITVQSMTITKTADVEGTLQQIYALAAAGADIVRCTCNEIEAAEGLARIVPRSPVPIVADIHHQYRMALAALEAGVHCLRLNPGNIRKPDHIKAVAQECKDRGIPIRIGVNGGSLDPALYAKYGGKVTPEAMVESAEMELAHFHEVDFDDVKISVKASSVPLMIEAYRLLADTVDHPLHLGVTEAGPPPAGLLKATAGMATLLAEGIGDTIRYSLTADPVEEARAGRQLLEILGLRERKNIDLIACPSCGRAEIDVIGVAKQAMEAFGDREIPLQVAVMGCVVNGPGEARDADIGIAAGNKRGHLFVKGRNVAVVPEDAMVSTLVEWAEFIHEHGVDAAIARVDTAKAAREAEKDRALLLAEKGDDVNHSEQRVELIHKRGDDPR
ncbi:MAG: flavodoxin-dependent (E)-4-hydroxy-3-methylbut-2-enyl-diphosphate synthase [Acidimicrobiales bacterium]|nr:flavodoxin-dependent (E)-4-hydroxy-3-methylbut-2-enyl-diphosphate synthase [Acidimicrobiales bacterium]